MASVLMPENMCTWVSEMKVHGQLDHFVCSFRQGVRDDRRLVFSASAAVVSSRTVMLLVCFCFC